MKIILLNGQPEKGTLDKVVDDFSKELEKREVSVNKFILRDMDIRFCTGCFSCCFKTPGVCIHKDDMIPILRACAESDLIIWASGLYLGNISTITKKEQDRMIPILLPHIGLYKKEAHHRLRYGKKTDIGLIIDDSNQPDPDDVGIVRKIFERISLNIRTRLRFFHTASELDERSADEAVNF